MSNLPEGAGLLDAAKHLVIDTLRQHPEGLTNSQVGTYTGLNPVIKKQNGYITWTILTYLVESGRVAKEGKLYRAL